VASDRNLQPVGYIASALVSKERNESVIARPARTALLTVACLASVAAPALIAQRTAVLWQVPGDISPSDRRAILEIGRALGIHEPQTVSVPMSSTCLLVEIESKPVLLGNQLLSDTVGVRRKNGDGCQPFGLDRRVQERGNWVAFLGASNPGRRERWRLRDGDWHVDAYLSSDVPYDDAVMIVQAIRREQLVDRRPPSPSSGPLRYIDANRILSIQRSASPQKIPRQYEILEGRLRAGERNMLIVRIRDGRVELHNHTRWMS